MQAKYVSPSTPDQPMPAGQGSGAEPRMPYLSGLNTAQRQAVEQLDGPVLVLAGAGTGKTRALTARLAHILLTGRASPQQILAVTFTNKAALEMKERVAHLIGRSVEGWWLGTFHSLAARLLRRHAELVGLKQNFTILDTDDQLRLIKQVLQAEGIDDKKFPPRGFLNIIERWKDRGLWPDRVGVAEDTDWGDGAALTIYRLYQDRLLTLNACDFGDLLLHNLAIFARDHDVLRQYQQQFRYILVDEYQDTNIAQYLWLRFLAMGHRNLCCVGDDDQSIYSWRGAEIGNILRFEQDFPGAAIIRLERNYRSTGHILGAASGLIAQNEGRLGKTLWTEDALGEKLRVNGYWDGEEEARAIGDEIETQQRRQVALKDMAILVRAGFQMREFEERLITLGIAYRVIGGPRFYERQEIRDALAYLRLVHQPSDDLAFERIVNLPRRGIGDATLNLLHVAARAQRQPLVEIARNLIDSDELKPAARRALGSFIADLDRWRGVAARETHVALAEIILDESGYTGMWLKDPSPEAPGRLENLKELVGAMGEFENLGGFLEHISLVLENSAGDSSDRLSLMTLHGAKGLEFDVVFLPGWEEGLFPHQRALDQGGTAALEEERRLAYVGITRAKKRAFISYAANRRVHNQWQSALPSRFLDELPASHIDREGLPHMRAQAPRPGYGERFQLLTQSRSRPATSQSGYAPVSDASPSWRSGDRVFHRKFGYGQVIASDGAHIDVRFEVAGDKRVMGNFLMRADQAH